MMLSPEFTAISDNKLFSKVTGNYRAEEIDEKGHQ